MLLHSLKPLPDKQCLWVYLPLLMSPKFLKFFLSHSLFHPFSLTHTHTHTAIGQNSNCRINNKHNEAHTPPENFSPFPSAAAPWPPPRRGVPRDSTALRSMCHTPVGHSESPAQNTWSRFTFCSLCYDSDAQFVPSSPRHGANKYLSCNPTPKATPPAVCPSSSGGLVHSAAHAKHLGFTPIPLFLSVLHK